MSIIQNKRIFYVDSHQKLNATDTDTNFSYYFDTHGEKYDYVAVLQATIPKSYYLVQDGRNTFVLNENGNYVTITVPIGNYSRSSFRSVIQSLLTTNSPLGFVYTVTIPNVSNQADDGKYTFAVSDPLPIWPVQLIFTEYLYEQFGFNKNSTNDFVNLTLKSVNVVKFQLKDVLYIHSDISDNGTDDILQEILGVDSPTFGNLLFFNYSFEAYSKPITNMKNIYNFYITDEDGVPINLNGQNVVFTLIMYKKDEVNRVVKNFLRLLALEK